MLYYLLKYQVSGGLPPAAFSAPPQGFFFTGRIFLYNKKYAAKTDTTPAAHFYLRSGRCPGVAGVSRSILSKINRQKGRHSHADRNL